MPADSTADPDDVRPLIVAARSWVDGDPDPVTRQQLSDLVADAEAGVPGAGEELADCAGSALVFGTAGLRGRMGPGPNRINSATVLRAAAALGAYLHNQLPAADPSPVVVVGFDARHGSRRFATDTVGALVAAGCRAAVLPRPLPTPVLAAAVRRLGADAGVMVTASHNPAQDNGYKVYLGGRVAADPAAGVQIVSPADTDIARLIAAGPAARDVPRAETGWDVLGEDLVESYVAAAAALGTGVHAGSGRRLRVVATALHGVGADVLDAVFAAAGFDPPLFVDIQRDPDPDFPTVAYPNPEEPGALDLAFALAARTGADLVVALDPDADRCALAVPDPTVPLGWRRLSGDATGGALAEYVLSRRETGARGADPGHPPAVASSVVSSSVLGRVAAAHGLRHVTTLTGFKWIARVPGLVFGYEEAIGYCVDPVTVRDKDGIATAVVACDLAQRLLDDGRTLSDHLDHVDTRYGVHATAPVTVRVRDVAVVAPLLATLLRRPPTTVGGLPVTAVTDLSVGSDGLAPTPGLRIQCGDAVRVVIRPSGTEPKLKAYVQVVREVGGSGPDARDLAAARRSASAAVELLVQDVTRLLL